jgi:hypothetical protein
MNKHTKWFWVRIGLLIYGFIMGLFYPSQAAVNDSGVDWMASLMVIIIMPFGMLFVIGIQAFNPISATEWRKPSWEINPFLLKEPLQFFHLCAFFFIASGLSACLSVTFRSVEGAPLAVLILSCGVAAWLGVQMSVQVFKKKKKIG